MADDMLLSPSMSAKLKNRECARKVKQGSPKLQQVLRERCRQRMREKRGQLFNRSRFGLEINSKNVQDTLTEIVRKEFNNLATTDWRQSPEILALINEPLDPEEALEIENEMINEEEQWILQEYEKMSKDEMEMLALCADQEIDEVVCPMCQKSNLKEDFSRVFCESCSFTLSTSVKLKEFGFLIGECVNAHSANCKEPPGFALLPENNNVCLYVVCQTCSTFAPVV